jgi:hypothetical protein
LLRIYDGNGSRLTLNSSRLRTLDAATQAADYLQAVADTMEDLKRFVHVDVVTKAACVASYIANTDDGNHVMHVCGVCGVRDPEATYTPVFLQCIPEGSWLEVPAQVLSRLDATPDVALLKRSGDDERVPFVPVNVRRRDFHNMYQCNKTNKVWHLVPEAVAADGTVYACTDCQTVIMRSVEKSSWTAQRPDIPECGDFDYFDDLYATNAPPRSIARGLDFGRLSHLRQLGIETDFSRMETMLLAEARAYSVVEKLKNDHRRSKLKGHVAVFFQEPVERANEPFGTSALRAALDQLSVFFVGPKGFKTQLERKALKFEGALQRQLRPEVIFNALTMRHALTRPFLADGTARDTTPPSIDEIVALIDGGRPVREHVDKTALEIDEDLDAGADLAQSDVAGVRATAMSDAQAQAAGAADGADSGVDIAYVAGIELPVQEMPAVIRAVESVVNDINQTAGDATEAEAEAEEGDAGGEEAELLLRRGEGCANDYAGGPSTVLKTWWPLFPLRRGLAGGKYGVTDTEWRHLFLYFDNRFAQCLPLLFYAANTKMRHAVNLAVHGRVSSDGTSFEKLKALVKAPGFQELLEEAKRDPKGEAARTVLATVCSFLLLSGRQVPHGPVERAAEMAKYFADHTYFGAANMFYSVAPNDVHSAFQIRYAHPYVGPAAFPAAAPSQFYDALRGSTDMERTAYRPCNADENELQRLAASNPVACVLSFHRTIMAVHRDLMRLDVEPSAHKTDKGVEEQQKGIYGTLYSARCVKETNSRDALHIHGQTHGGLTPQLLADLADHPELLRAALDALDTHVTAQLPLEYHALHVAEETLGTFRRRDAAWPIPKPPPKQRGEAEAAYADRLLKEWWPVFEHHALLVVMDKNYHTRHGEHDRTCFKNKRGRTGCRMCAHWMHGEHVAKTRCVQLLPVDHAQHEGTAHADDLPFRCALCYAGGAMADEQLTQDAIDEAVQKEDVKRCAFFTAHAPIAGAAAAERLLEVDVARPALPRPEDGSALAALVMEGAVALGTAEHNRELLRRVIAPSERLGQMLRRPGLEALCRELTELCSAGDSDTDMQQLREQKAAAVRSVLLAWSDVRMRCANGVIADANLALSGCVGSNAMPITLGAGIGAKVVACYQIKYMGKNSLPVDGIASILLQTHELNKKYPSTAEDAGSDSRNALHLIQGAMNRVNAELPATVAAQLVLGQRSSEAFRRTCYVPSWDLRTLAVHAAAGTPEAAFQDADADGDSDGDGDEEVDVLLAEDDAVDDTYGKGAKRNQATADADRVLMADQGGGRVGTSGVCFVPETNKTVAVSPALHYGWRDLRLANFSASEFFQLFYVRKMDKADQEQYAQEQAEAQGTGTALPPRPEQQPGDALPEPAAAKRGAIRLPRYWLAKQHPLHSTHVIRPQRKLPVPKMGGRRAPREPEEGGGPKFEAALRAYAKYMIANFVPWSCHDGRELDLSYEAWGDWVETLRQQACRGCGLEGLQRQEAMDDRTVAHGRLCVLESMRAANRARSWLVSMHQDYRALHRTLWKGTEPFLKEQERARGRGNGGVNAIYRAERKGVVRGSGLSDLTQRLERAAKFKKNAMDPIGFVIDKMLTPASTAGNQRAGLAKLWGVASEPKHKTSTSQAQMGTGEIARLIKVHETLPDRQGQAPAPQLPPPNAGAAGGAGDFELPEPPEAFRRFGDSPAAENEGYGAAAAEWNSCGACHAAGCIQPNGVGSYACARCRAAKPGEPPLNPEQRRFARELLGCIQLRAAFLARGGGSAKGDLMRAYRKHGLSSVVLLHGAGGAGKSAVLHAVRNEMRNRGLGELLITAYTGVAAAPFGGTTMCRMANLRPNSGGEHDSDSLRGAGATDVTQHQEKFKKETGLPSIAGVGALVIDEVSFVSAKLLGHFEARIRQLVHQEIMKVADDADGELFGTLPVVLAGDNWQLGPVRAIAWYKTLCDNTLGNGSLRLGRTATARGIEVLQAAKRMDLVRIMRSVNDQPFVDVQKGIRVRTAQEVEALPAVLGRLTQMLKRHQPSDVCTGSGWDAEWRFAPIGVLGNAERDLLNARQIEAFAKAFDLPLIKWRLPVNFTYNREDEEEVRILDELYRHEPGLWGYFVEGAPGYMTKTICAPRKLVNGSPVLLRSLVFEGNVVPEAVSEALAGGGFRVIELEEPPEYINVIVGGAATGDGVRLWHGVRLDDLSDCIESLEGTDEQVVPIGIGKHEEDKLYLTSMYAAQHAYPYTVPAGMGHAVSLAFAVTDFKLQGRTLPRLILSVGTNRGGMPMRLSKLYVLISRVQAASGLRMLPGVPGGDWDRVLKRLTLLLPDPDLLTWENGYDENGYWSDARALLQRETLEAKLDSARKAATRTKARDDAARKKAAGHGARPAPQGAPVAAPTVTAPRVAAAPAASAVARAAAALAEAEEFELRITQGSSSSGSSASGSSGCLSSRSQRAEW